MFIDNESKLYVLYELLVVVVTASTISIHYQSLIRLFVPSFIDSIIDSFVHSYNHSFIHSFHLLLCLYIVITSI